MVSETLQENLISHQSSEQDLEIIIRELKSKIIKEGDKPENKDANEYL